MEKRKQQAKHAVCDGCGVKWNVSRTKDVGRIYICPKCERRLSGRGGVHEGNEGGKANVRKP